MGYNTNGIVNGNLNQALMSGKDMGIGANSNFGFSEVTSTDDSKGVGKAMGLDAGALFVQGKNDKPSTTMENFKEYMRDKQEQAKEDGEDLATKEKEAREQAKKVSQSISSEELRQLEMMGIDVDTANMTDIMGMVNTLRYNQDVQETAELMAKIAVDKGDADSVTMVGGNVTAGGVEISSVSVGDVLVAGSKPGSDVIENNSVESNPAELTEDVATTNAKETAKADNIKLSDSEAIYILKNNMDLSKENLYKAHFSGIKLADGASEKLIADMESQLARVIEQAGFDVDEETMDAAKLLMNNDVPVTTDNLKKYMDMKPYMGRTPDEAGIPEKVVAVSEEQLDAKATKLYEDVRSIDIKQVYQMATEGKMVTIAAAVKYNQVKTNDKVGNLAMNLGVDKLSESALEEPMFTDAKAVTAMRQMEEIRLSMTSAMAGKLIRMDMNVDTRDLTKVVSMLKNIELKMTKDAFYAAGVNPTEENVSLYQEISTKVNAIGKADAGIIAAPLMGEAFTIEGLHRRSSEISGQFETVRRSYEAVGTAPRRDMGDSITKAFANVQDMLDEMNMPVNYETERAVRILGYNQLEITEANINQIMDYDRQVNDMLNTFYPEAVIGMIKDGINPLDVPIDELNKKIRDKNYNNGVTEAKNFATYLRDMEKQGEITPEQRESYVGIYRVMEKLAKSGDREAGYIFANGGRLTVRNLITAMRSRKAAGVDVGIDDSFGMLQDMNVTGKKMDAQIAGAFDMAAVDVEDVTQVADAYNSLNRDAERFMEENSVEVSAVNIRAVNVMLNQPGSVYSLVSELFGKMKFSTNAKAELIDEETENMANSMSGEEVSVNPADFALESILEHLRGSEEMSLKYEDLRTNLTELMYQWGAAGTLSKMDIATIKTVNAGFNIMSGMAKKDKFQIPVKTEQGTKVMNLTIMKNGENPGLVQVSMRTESYGEISASIKSDDSGALVGQIISDSSEGNYALKDTEGKLKESLAEVGYNADEVVIGSVSNIDLVAYPGITSEKLYQVSVAVVKAMAGIV